MTCYLFGITDENPLTEAELATIAAAVETGFLIADGERIVTLIRFKDWCRRKGRAAIWCLAGRVTVEGGDLERVQAAVGNAGKVKAVRGRIEIKASEPVTLAARLAGALYSTKEH